MISPQLRLALIYLLASPDPPPNAECTHHWLRNGKRNGLQQWICKYCGKSKSGDGLVKRGRPFKAK